MVFQSSSVHVKGGLGLQYFSLLLTLSHLSLGLKLKPKSTHHQSFLVVANTTLTLSCHTLHLLKFCVVYTYESLTCNCTQVQRWKTLVHNYSHVKNRKFQETENALIMVLTTTTVYISTREQNCISIHYPLVLLLQYMILLRL
jgi:hypothetical protein